jgi:hypothetical protein
MKISMIVALSPDEFDDDLHGSLRKAFVSAEYDGTNYRLKPGELGAGACLGTRSFSPTAARSPGPARRW